MEEFLISFVVLAYKVENFIEDCLKSLINQHNPDSVLYQICLCLDKSYQVDTDSIFHQYASKYPFIKLIFDDMENTKIADSRATLIREADGKYISFVDGDDFITSHTVYQVSKILLEKSPDLLTTNVSQFIVKNNIMPLFDIYGAISAIEIDKNNPLLVFKYLTYAGLHGKFFKSSLVKGSFIAPSCMEDDKVLSTILYINSKIIYHIPTPTVTYRVHNMGFLHRLRGKKVPSYSEILEDMECLLNDVESRITDNIFLQYMKNLIRYSLLSTSMAYHFYKYPYIYKSARYFKIKNTSRQILKACHIFYEKYIGEYNSPDFYLFQSLDWRLQYYIKGQNSREFIATFNNKKVRFIYNMGNLFKKILPFYK